MLLKSLSSCCLNCVLHLNKNLIENEATFDDFQLFSRVEKFFQQIYLFFKIVFFALEVFTFSDE